MVDNPSKKRTRAAALDNSPKKEHDRRLHQRANLPLKARFVTDSGTEWTGLVTNISSGGALIKAKYPPAFGQSVVLYIDQLGRLEGKVVRSEKDRFAVHYTRKRSNRVQVADELTSAVNQTRRRNADRRSGPRIKHDTPAIVFLEDGRAIKCSILDISLTGASIGINPRPPLGMRLILGRMTAKVVRRHEKGVGVVFTGAADRMDEVIEETAHEPESFPTPSGSNLAPSFGKKRTRD